jgi:hypothetical protein
MSIILTQTKNHNRPHLSVKNIDSDPHQQNEKEPDSHMPGSFGFHVISLRVGKEISGTLIHPIFRPSLVDLQSKNPQNSTTIPPVSLIQIDQI